MRCCALTPEKRRCPNDALDATNYCAAHRDDTARERQATLPNRFGGIFARVRGALNAPIYDGGKYDVPGWLNDAPTALVIEHLCTHPDSMIRWMAAFVLRKRRAP
jgi:hypothetical protein